MAVDFYEHCPRLPGEGSLDPRALFVDGDGAPCAPSEAPVELEIGPGRGWFTIERLEIDPNAHVIGLEIRRKWATIVDDRLKKRGLSHRGRIFAEDATRVVPRFLPHTVQIAYLHFPDPWWKKRHRKRLVLSKELLRALSRALVVGGELLIQTDVFERADEYEALVSACPAFVPWESETRVSDHPHGARSPRERQAMLDGLPIIRLRYRCLGPLWDAD